MPADLVSKQMRQDMILEVIKSREVHNQLELIKYLEERGITATQSSVSRDIHELSIAKVDGRYVVAVLPVHGGTWSGPASEADRPAIAQLNPAGPNMLVIRTSPGQAGNVGLSINRARWPEVCGCVAGDDTLFVATAGKREQIRLISRLQEFMDVPQADIEILSEEMIDALEPEPMGV